MLRALAICVALAMLVAALPAAAAKPRQGPSGTAFYKAPSPLPGKRHGDLIWSAAQRGSDAIAGAGSNRLVLYRSEGVAGKIAVSGSVAVPKGKPPKGGWPVVSWAHGTTGIADICAPTRNGSLTAYIHPLLASWLKHGWAVVRTDYEGLGPASEVHPYLNGRSAGQGVLDAVRAARQLDPRIGSRMAIAGHSQGGHAALFAASLAHGYTPELNLRGTDAFAPASHLSEQLPLVTAITSPSPLSALAIQVARGLEVSRPALNVPGVLSDVATARYGQVDALCEGDLLKPGSFGDLAPASLFREGTDFAPFSAALRQLDDPEDVTIKSPLRVDQGTADNTVLPLFTDQTVASYKGRGTKVTYAKHPGATHGNVTSVGGAAATTWLADRLR